MEIIFTAIAMALDTLPQFGRVMLLAVLLTAALCGLAKAAPLASAPGVNLLFRKGAVSALLLVPGLVFVTNLQMPVHVEQVTHFQTMIPTYLCYAVMLAWVASAIYALFKLSQEVLQSQRLAKQGDLAPAPMQQRLDHWCKRLSIAGEISLIVKGADEPWHSVYGMGRANIVCQGRTALCIIAQIPPPSLRVTISGSSQIYTR